MKTLEEIRAQMAALAATDMDDAAVAQYEALEVELGKATRIAELRRRETAYSTPSTPSVATAFVSKEDAQLEKAFEAYLRTGMPNADISHLYAQTETTTAGGYLVPTTFLNRLTEVMKLYGGIANVAETINTSDGTPIKWPTFDDTANSAEIVAINGAAASAGADLAFGQDTLGAFRYVSTGAGNAPIKVPVELLQDAAYDVAGVVARALGTRLARKMAVDFAQGTGSGQPLGLMRVVPTQALAGASLAYNDLVDLMLAIDPAYLPNAKWVFNYKTAGTVAKIVDSASRPLWQPSAQAGIGGEVILPGLLGFPVVLDQGVRDAMSPGLGLIGNGHIAFGDIRESYIVRKVGGVVINVNPYTSMTNGEVEYSGYCRADATIKNAKAFATAESKH